MFGTISKNEDRVEALLDLLFALGRRNSLRDPLASLMAEAPLGAVQMHAVGWLHRDAPMSMGDLARRLGVSEKAVTGIVDRLEREGYAARTRSVDDRRVVEVSLTATGTAFARDVETHLRTRLGRFLELLGAEDSAAFQRILRNLLTRLESGQTS